MERRKKKERKPRVIIATASRRIKHKGTERLNLGISFHHAGPRSAATVTVILHRFYNRPKKIYYIAWPRRCCGHVCEGVVSCLSNTPQVVGPAAKVADAGDAVLLDGVTLPRIINLLAGPAGPPVPQLSDHTWWIVQFQLPSPLPHAQGRFLVRLTPVSPLFKRCTWQEREKLSDSEPRCLTSFS